MSLLYLACFKHLRQGMDVPLKALAQVSCMPCTRHQAFCTAWNTDQCVLETCLPLGLAANSPSCCTSICIQNQWVWPSLLLPVAGFSKKAKRKEVVIEEEEQEEEETAEEEEQEFTLKRYAKLMENALHHLQSSYGKIHAGRASLGLLEPIEVLTHEERLPLLKIATVTVRNPQMLAATVYNSEDLEPALSAIRSSPLQLQPRVEGKEVLVPIPRPTLEGLQAMARMVRQEAEKAKASVREVRKKALEAVKKEFRAADDRRRMEKEVQKLHDLYVENIDKLKDLKIMEQEVSHR